MKVSELWLRSLIDSSLSISQLAEQLTNAGIEVDSFEMSAEINKNNHTQPSQGVLTLKVPANRGDCLSMEGVARELALLTKNSFKPIKVSQIIPSISDEYSAQLQAPEFCPRYSGRVIKKINPVAQTPDWLKQRLELADIHSVSAVVDVLNYVMIEVGQPLHAFDLDKLSTPLMVRLSTKGETIQLLNQQTIELEAGTLIIADKKKPQAIAGVMGGLESSVTNNTTHLFIESAFFDPIAIRLASQRYGLRTDSSYRFERGIDPRLQERALNRVTELLLNIVGGEAGIIIELKNDAWLPKMSPIFLRKNRINTLLGQCPSDTEIMDILNRADMIVETQIEGFIVTPPSYRHDIALEVDLIEEIARVYGFEKFLPEKVVAPIEFYAVPEKRISLSGLKKTLANRGYFEAMTYSFIDPKIIDIFQTTQKPYLLANPISAEMAAMRPSLWLGLLQAVQHNQRRQQPRARLFEVGSCFIEDLDHVKERTVLAGIAAGLLYPEQWGIKNRVHDFFDIKGDVEALLAGIENLATIKFEPSEQSELHPGKAAKIISNGKVLGVLGALHPRITKALDVIDPVFVFELDLAAIHLNIPKFRDLSKFPAIRRDIALVVSDHVFADEIKSAIVKCVGQWLREVSIFDVYQGPRIGPGKKSIAVGLILQHPSRTLVEEEVAEKVKEVILVLDKQFGATLRE